MSLIAHSSPGGNSDVFLREMSELLCRYIDATFVVENMSACCGAHVPLSETEITAKYRANCAFGGFDDGRTGRLLAALEGFAAGWALNLTEARA